MFRLNQIGKNNCNAINQHWCPKFSKKKIVTVPRLLHHHQVHYLHPKNQACVQYRMSPFEKSMIHILHPQIDSHSDSIFRVLAVIRLLKYIFRVYSPAKDFQILKTLLWFRSLRWFTFTHFQSSVYSDFIVTQIQYSQTFHRFQPFAQIMGT